MEWLVDAEAANPLEALILGRKTCGLWIDSMVSAGIEMDICRRKTHRWLLIELVDGSRKVTAKTSKGRFLLRRAHHVLFFEQIQK